MKTPPNADLRHLVRIVCASALCLSGLALLFMGFWVAPTGVIDNSILIAFGEAMTFSGALFGVIIRPRS